MSCQSDTGTSRLGRHTSTTTSPVIDRRTDCGGHQIGLPTAVKQSSEYEYVPGLLVLVQVLGFPFPFPFPFHFPTRDSLTLTESNRFPSVSPLDPLSPSLPLLFPSLLVFCSVQRAVQPAGALTSSPCSSYQSTKVAQLDLAFTRSHPQILEPPTSLPNTPLPIA